MACKTFLPFCRFPFHFVDCFFCCAEALKFDVLPLVDLLLLLVLLVSYPKIIAKINIKEIFPMSSSRSFMVPHLMFNSLIYFLLIFVSGVR